MEMSNSLFSKDSTLVVEQVTCLRVLEILSMKRFEVTEMTFESHSRSSALTFYYIIWIPISVYSNYVHIRIVSRMWPTRSLNTGL